MSGMSLMQKPNQNKSNQTKTTSLKVNPGKLDMHIVVTSLRGTRQSGAGGRGQGRLVGISV